MRWDVVGNEKNSLGGVFIDLARKARSLNPSAKKPTELLIHHLLESGAHDEATVMLTEAIARFPTESRFHLMLADAYHRAGRPELARRQFHQAPAVPIADRETTLFRLELMMKLGVQEDAVQMATTTLALDPSNKQALALLGEALRLSDRLEEMLPYCRAALKQDPASTRARYELAVALAILGRCEQARQLIDLEQFITITEIAAGDSSENGQTLEAAVAGEIVRNSTLAKDPPNKATQGGLQTVDRLPHPGDQAIAVVLERIRAAVDSFEEELASGLEDPFVKHKPNRAWLNAWAVVYPGDGRQSSHIHPDGWLSGVYFVCVPPPREDHPRGGCLVLGSLEGATPSSLPWGLRGIHPIAGQVVMFPSYIPHSTVPTKSSEPRICISFDVIPVK
jgi:tetratricopeptide (TPR) repeat protein